jgi:hypothetical protein
VLSGLSVFLTINGAGFVDREAKATSLVFVAALFLFVLVDPLRHQSAYRLKLR